jgi:hypothetical protein
MEVTLRLRLSYALLHNHTRPRQFVANDLNVNHTCIRVMVRGKMASRGVLAAEW